MKYLIFLIFTLLISTISFGQNLLFFDDVKVFDFELDGSVDPTITLQGTGKITIKWGDGNYDDYTLTGIDQNITHTYTSGGTYKLKIYNSQFITKFSTSTNNAYSFNLAELEKLSNLSYFFVYGSNTITGNLAELEKLSNLSYFRVHGSNTITGNLSSLSSLSNLSYFLVYGSNTITGNLSSLLSLSDLGFFFVSGSNTITGNLSSLSSLSNLSYFLVYGSNTITGDLSSLSGLSTLYYFEVSGSNTISDYSTSTFTQTGLNRFWSGPVSGSGLSSAEVDTLLIDIDADVTWAGSGRALWIAGNNAARTSASDAAVISLQGKGVTVITN